MSSPIIPDPIAQLHADATVIVAEIERITGRKSTWSGRVIIGNEVDALSVPAYMGAKPWNCDIALHQSRLFSPARYSTLIHEALHSVSVGLNDPDFQRWRGWEEGVVEACTRLFRDQIMAAGNLPPVTDTRASYNRYLTNLESLRLRTNKGETEFYLTLLATPLANREATVLQWIQDVEANKSLAQIAQETDFERQELLR